MRIELRAQQPLAGGQPLLGAFADRPGAWLPIGTRPRAFGAWTLRLHGASASRDVALTVGEPWRDGSSLWRAIRWEPLGDAGELLPTDTLLPVFVGELGLHVAADDTATLQLDGTYVPPGGIVGGLLDRAGLHHVAESTADHLLREIAERLTSLASAHVGDRLVPEGPATAGPVGPGPRAAGP